MFVVLWRKLTNISIIKAGPSDWSPVTSVQSVDITDLPLLARWLRRAAMFALRFTQSRVQTGDTLRQVRTDILTRNISSGSDPSYWKSQTEKYILLDSTSDDQSCSLVVGGSEILSLNRSVSMFRFQRPGEFTTRLLSTRSNVLTRDTGSLWPSRSLPSTEIPTAEW